MNPYIVTLMDEDGVVFKSREGQWWTAHCFAHDDSTPSLSVNTATGGYYCHGCHIKGNAYTYLLEVRNMPKVDAIEKMKAEGGWTDDKSGYEQERGQQMHDEGVRNKSERPKWAEKLPTRIGGLDLAKKFSYLNQEGRVVLAVCRYDGFGREGVPKKTYRQYTPSTTHGGYWLCSPLKSTIPAVDRLDRLPLYNGHLIRETDESRQIWVVEGEKCADLVMTTAIKNEEMRPLAVSMPGGSGVKIDSVDLDALYGRVVVLIADADKPGRKMMIRLGRYLNKKVSCTMRYALPKGEGGYDIGDALLEGGFAAASEWLNRAMTDPAEAEDDDHMFPNKGGSKIISPPAGEDKEPHRYAHGECDHFRIMGISRDGLSVYFFLKEANLPIGIKTSGLISDGNLLNLAPIAFWREMSGGSWGSQAKLDVVSEIINIARKKGVIDDIDLGGRGLIKSDDGWLYNLGDRYLHSAVNGAFSASSPLRDAPILLSPGPSLPLSSDLKEARRYARELYDTVMQYRWASKGDGRRVLGWMVSSLICGGLKHRPNLWLSAPAGTGKTFIIERVIMPFFGTHGRYYANPSVAGISQSVKNDAIPIVIDEFEPEPQKENTQRDLLALLRTSTGGESQHVRGTQSGEAIGAKLRFQAMVVSVARPRLSAADESRFATAGLSITSVENWPKVRGDIATAADKKKLEILRSAIIRNAPMLMDKIDEVRKKMEQDAEVELDERTLLIHATLTACAGWLSGDFTYTCDGTDAKDDADSVAGEILGFIMSSTVRDGIKENTLANYMIQCREYGESTIAHKTAAGMLEKYGLRLWFDQEAEKECLLVAYANPQLLNLLKSKGSRARAFSLQHILMQTRGVWHPVNDYGQKVRIRLAGTRASCVAVGFDTLYEAGFEMPPNDNLTDADSYS